MPRKSTAVIQYIIALEHIARTASTLCENAIRPNPPMTTYGAQSINLLVVAEDDIEMLQLALDRLDAPRADEATAVRP